MASQDAIRAEWEALNKNTKNELENPKPVEELPEVADNPPPAEQSEEEVTRENEQKIEEKKEEYPSRTQEQTNWKRIREQNRELERKLAEMEEAIRRSQAQEKPDKEKEQEDYDLADDALTEGKHYKALKREVRNLNEALSKERQERDKLAVEARLRANYPDIFKVVTKDNLAALAEVEPELVETIVSSPNMYSQHVAAYKNIKKYGIGTEDPNAMEKERAQRNLAKPKPAATVSPRQGESPLAEADRFARGMTPELQSQLLREMEDAISNR